MYSVCYLYNQSLPSFHMSLTKKVAWALTPSIFSSMPDFRKFRIFYLINMVVGTIICIFHYTFGYISEYVTGMYYESVLVVGFPLRHWENALQDPVVL